MEEGRKDQELPFGLLLVQGGSLPQHLRHFLEDGRPQDSLDTVENSQDSIKFYIVPSDAIEAAFQQDLMGRQALWIDENEALRGVAALNICYSLAGRLHSQKLTVKPLKLQFIRDAPESTASFKATITGKAYIQLYRMVQSLFPALERWESELDASGIASLDHIASPLRAYATHEGGLVLELDSKDDRLTARGLVAINFKLACLELQAIDLFVLSTSPTTSALSRPSSFNKCLRSLHSLDDAISALRAQITVKTNSKSSSSPPSSSSSSLPPFTKAPSIPRDQAIPLSFQSPSKPPRKSLKTIELVKDGVLLVEGCSSAQLREGATMLQTAAATSEGGAAGIEAGAMEALVTAASTVLPSTIMGTTEQLTVLILAITALLDADKARSGTQGATRLVRAFIHSLQTPCANPIVLCKLLLALLQRPDVRFQAVDQNLWAALSSTYLRKSPLLEPLAKVLLSPTIVSTVGKQRNSTLSSQVGSSPTQPMGTPGSASRERTPSSPLDTNTPPISGKLSVPRLLLPSYSGGDDSLASGAPSGTARTSNPSGGLTRATRRELSTTPADWHPPSVPWGSPRPIKDTTATSEMESLAEALGESLMAMDLPSIVAHKRQSDLLYNSREADAIPPELLQPDPTPSSRHQKIQAHAIFTSVGSLQTLESSSTGSEVSLDTFGKGMLTDMSNENINTSTGGAVEDYFDSIADTAEVKNLLLQAMSSALPLLPLMNRRRRAEIQTENILTAEPSPILAAEILSMPLSGLSPQQESLRSSCLQLLARIALRRQGVSSDEIPCQHVFLVAIGAKLAQLLSGGTQTTAAARTQAAHFFETAAEYVNLVDCPSASIAVADHCLGAVTSALGALHIGSTSISGKPEKWDATSWQLLNSLLLILGPSMAHCKDAEAGRSFISAVLGDFKAAAMLANVGNLVLVRSEESASKISAIKTKISTLQRDLLGFYTALAGLLARQSPIALPSTTSPSIDTSHSVDPGSDVLVIVVEPNGRGQRRKLTRRHAINYFLFLASPNSDFVRRVLDHAGVGGGTNSTSSSARQHSGGLDTPSIPAPPTSEAVRLRPALFDLLKILFSAPGSPFVSDKSIADYYVRFHFIQFLKLYYNPHRDHQALFLCRQHLSILLALANSGAPHVRHRFQQLSVVDFFVKELSLEFEASQPGGGASASVTDLLSAGRIGSEGKLQKKNSPAQMGSKDSPLQSSHRRSKSQSGLPLNVSGNAPSPPVPKLRLPGSASHQSLDSSSHPNEQYNTPTHQANTGRRPSRLGLQITAPGATGPDRVLMLPSEDEDEDDSVVEDSDDDSDGETGGRISSTVATTSSLPVPPLDLPRPHLSSLSSASGGAARPLDRSISAAISLDKGWMPSARTAAAASEVSGVNVLDTEPSLAGKQGVSKFVFSGDLDEDVEMLEALEKENEQGTDTDGATSSDSENDDDDDDDNDDEQQQDNQTMKSLTVDVRLLDLGPQALELTPDSEDLTGSVGDGGTTVPQPAISVPRLAVPPKGSDGFTMNPRSIASSLPDSPPPRPMPPPVPRLAITSSMHSTLEARMASAELQVALEAEMSKRKAGRSFFGDLERSALGKGKMQAATHGGRASRGVSAGPSDQPSPGESFSNLPSSPAHHNSSTGPFSPAVGAGLGLTSSNSSGMSYSEERSHRLVYRDQDLHLQVLVLIFTLIIDSRGQLNPVYCDQYPWDRKLHNIPFVLHHHLNHADNRSILPKLLPALHALGAPALRLLRTLCAAFFRPSWYTQRARISGVAGAYATVYRCALPPWAGESSVVLKLLDTPKHIQDRCAQVDFHSEVTILDTLAKEPYACAMYDFGLDPGADALLLVLKDYRCSLKQWRSAQPSEPSFQLRLYYAVFREVVVAVGQLLSAGVIHFDLKCDNILLEPLPGCTEADFWSPKSAVLPFKVVLADFGESKLAEAGTGTGAARGMIGGLEASFAAAPVAAAAGAMTARARGTDAFKSPEMLLVGGAVHKGHRAYDRRRRQGAGAASDVWSLGCLLYELVTGKLLFSDTDWLQLVARVTSANMQLITDERASAVADLPGILDLLHYILVRDPALRPTLKDTLTKLDITLAVHDHEIPSHRPTTHGFSPPNVSAHAIPSRNAASMSSHVSLHNDQILPLELVVALPVLPGLLFGPTSCIQRQSLMNASVALVLIIADHPNTVASQLPSSIILADDVLLADIEAAASVGAECYAVCGRPAQGGTRQDSEMTLHWLESALIQLQNTANSDKKVLLAAQTGREGDAALVTIAYIMAVQQCSPYQAMVRASHWGVDLYMDDTHLEALKLLSEKNVATVS